MFDRIARVYDRMNSVMTAGMHHRWRERAADLARVGPGVDRARRGHRHRRPRRSSSRARGAEVTGSDFAPAMLEIARRKAPGLRFEEGDALSARPTRTARSTRPRSGFGARNFADLDRGLARDGARRRGRAAASWCSRSPPRRSRRCPGSSAPGSTRSCPRSGGSRATRTPTPTCRAACAASPARRSWPRGWPRRGSADVRWILTAGGIIAIHAGTKPVVSNTAQAQLGAVLAAGGRGAGRAARADRGAARGGGGRPRRGARPPRAAARSPPAGSACGRCSSSSAPASRDERLVAAGAAVELLHMATLVHDDVLDARRAAPRARRPCSPRAAARPPRPPATCSSRAPSRSWPPPAARRRCAALSAASSALARGELMQRADAWSEDVTPERYLERCRLKTASLFEASCRLGALFGGRPELAEPLGQLRRAARRGVPDARRRARRVRARRSAPASRAAPTCSTGR